MHTKKLLIALEVVIVFLVLTVYLWSTIQSTQRQKQTQALEISASQLKNGIEAFISEKISILLQVRNFWVNSPSVTHERFSGFCKAILGQTPGFQAIEYGDASNRVVWVEPFLTNEPSPQSSVASEPVRYRTLQRAILKRNVSLTPVLELSPGVKGFFAYVPIFREGGYEGTIVGVFKLDTLFSLIFDSVVRQRYNILVHDGETQIHADFNFKQPWTKSDLLAKQTITMPDQNWGLIIWPKENEAELGFIGSAVLILGTALSFALGTLVWSLLSKAEQADVYAEVLECTAQIRVSSDSESIYRVVEDTCKRISKVQHVGFFRANDKQGRFEPAWYSGGDETGINRFFELHLRYGNFSLLNMMQQERRTISIQPGHEHGTVGTELLHLFKAQNLALVPMLYRGDLTGFMVLDYPQNCRISNRELSILEALACDAAFVIETLSLTMESQTYIDL